MDILGDKFYTKNKWSNYIRLIRYKNIPDMIFDTINYHHKRTAMRWFKGKEGFEVKAITYGELGFIIKEAYYALHSLGYKKGDHIAIIGKTSQNWAWADLGIQCLGGVTVGIYPSLKPNEIQYILKDSESTAVFISNQKYYDKFRSIEKKLPKIKHVILFEDFVDPQERDNILNWDEFLDRGKEYRRDNPNLINESISNIGEDDLASLIYTSGTTGIPKGVMLTHKNFLSDVVALSAVYITYLKGEKPWNSQSLTFMPYAHSFGRTVEEYGLIFNSTSINYVGGRPFDKAFKIFRPTLMIGVPYVYQKLYERIVDDSSSLPIQLQIFFDKALITGNKFYTNIKKGIKNSMALKLKYEYYKKLILERIQKELGGHLRLLVTASAAVPEELLLFFWSCGLNMVEGYGLTEAGPATHLSRSIHNSDFRPKFNKKVEIYEKLGSVGPILEIQGNPYENMEQKLGLDGELLLRGPPIMKGYWKKPELTKAALDEDGWLHTGDLAKIDGDGYVKIIGRSKAIIKLSTGKIVSPAVVEKLIVPHSRRIHQIVLVGQEKKYLTAIFVPRQKSLRKYCDQNGIIYEKWEDIIRYKEVQELLKDDILSFIKDDVANYSIPKKFAISMKPFTVEDGYITPTLKYKRNKIYKNFKKSIDRLYEIDDTFYFIRNRNTDFHH